MKLPKVVALDLDGTIWDPEMYQLYGGAPFKQKSPALLVDRKGEEVYLHTGVYECFEYVKQNGIIMAVASTTDEPAWARECLDKFILPSAQVSLSSRVDITEIYKANKQAHMRAICKKAGCDLQDILFIDNQMNNINACQQIGVPSFFTPKGLTTEMWHAALVYFDNKSK